ncbi:CHAT domain-containing protein [Streptomyces sp. NPDC002755]|uniref:CHAT domain-containing protein n=1 Tax=Streptomyces sp. NPDC002884 TaxID=3154544 RepID=UPI003333D0A8
MVQEQLITALDRRVRRYRLTRNPTVLLCAQAAHESWNLLEALHAPPGGPVPPGEADTVYALTLRGWEVLGRCSWYQYRIGTGSPEENQRLLRLAETAFGAVHRVKPRAVPARLREEFARRERAARRTMTAFGEEVARLGDALPSLDGNLGGLRPFRERFEALLAELPDAHPRGLEIIVGAGRLRILEAVAAEDVAEVRRAVSLLRESVARRMADSSVAGLSAEVMALLTESDHGHFQLVGTYLTWCYERSGDMAELDDAIAALTRAMDHAKTLPEGFGHLIDAAQRCLVPALKLRAEGVGDVAAAEAAVLLARLCRARVPEGGAQWSERTVALAGALQVQHTLTGECGPAAEALDLHRRAVDAAAAPGELSSCLQALALSLSLRYDRELRADDLAESVDVQRRALHLAEGASVRRERSANLARLLMIHHRAVGLPEARDEAVRILRSVLTCPDDTVTYRIGLLRLLGDTLRTVAHDGHDRGALEEAEEAWRTALELRTGTPALRAGLSVGLARCLRSRHELFGDSAALDEAVAVLTDAADVSSSGAEELRTVRFLAETAEAAGYWGQAAAAYGRAVDLLPRLLSPHRPLADQRQVLRGQGDLVESAVAATLEAGRPGDALLILERGRGLLAAHRLSHPEERAGPRADRPGPDGELQRLTSLLDDPDPDPDPDPARRRSADAHRDAMLRRIRALPGFEGFLYGTGARDLLPVAEQGPIISVNVSPRRSDALILTPGGVLTLRLPGLTGHELAARTEKFPIDVVAAETGSPAERFTAQAGVRDTLGWLWDVLAAPVLDCLGHTAPPSDDADDAAWPRVWWALTGPLATLPVHAAGDHERAVSVLDRAVSSYVPSIRALRHARTRPSVPPARRRGLVVEVSEAPGYGRLTRTREERAHFARRVRSTDLLSGAGATFEAVTRKLPDVHWAHFACHGTADPRNPSTSHLLLHDRPLLVSDIFRMRLEHAELAYLSACSTAASGSAAHNETMDIASSLMVAGFQHVVATRWPVGDHRAAEVAAAFYTHLADAPALALHRTTRTMRDATPRLPTKWAAYVHTGI